MTLQKFRKYFVLVRFRKDFKNGGFGFTCDILRLTLSLRKLRSALEDRSAGDENGARELCAQFQGPGRKRTGTKRTYAYDI